jgi:hypothetical protein
MRQTNLGAFFGGGNEQPADDGSQPKNGDHLKRDKPTIDDIDKEFEISKETKKLAEQSNVLFNIATVPAKVNLIDPAKAKKLRPIDTDGYRPDKDCVFNPEYITT